MSKEIVWMMMQIALSLLFPVFILGLISWQTGKVGALSVHDLFPAEGLGYFSLTFCAGMAFQLHSTSTGLDGWAIAAFLILAVLIGINLSVAISERMRAAPNPPSAAVRIRGLASMALVTVGSIVLSITYLSELTA